MKKKYKVLLVSSIIANIVFVIALVWGYLTVNLMNEQLFYTEVQYKLVELDGLIEQQKENNWSEPNLVTTQLSAVLNGIEVATSSAKYAKWISNEERLLMEHLYAALARYPHDELYTFSDVSESDRKDFEALQAELQNIGIGMNMTMSTDWKTFIDKVETFVKELQRISSL
ncbi:hypothetical protein QT711_18885 [Sporosarcina saromensis]|uniref:Uncharacterized protein n=1 Tax=Sporosarcina saromensis TaxID=359365 RepID=A0ABU4GE07_9BACL|nr:hypothetical protein [Sporosarcina saromensis]MDW0115220.1 hypothetical protein [Sporosarcina saromensis]